METKIAVLPVRELKEGYPVELWVNDKGRLVVRTYSVDRYGESDLDLFDLVDWVRTQRGEPYAGAKLCRNAAGRDRQGA